METTRANEQQATRRQIKWLLFANATHDDQVRCCRLKLRTWSSWRMYIQAKSKQ